MIRYAVIFLLFISVLDLPGKELKVLMIGNSFSRSVYTFLPQLVNAEKKHKLHLTSAYIGDCSLEMHYDHLVKAEKNNAHKPYKMSAWDSAENPPGSKKSLDFPGNVNELVKKNQYDIITIQQRSVTSIDFASYEPYAGKIISYLRKYQKNAEIVIQQTWAYRYDARRYSVWKFGQEGMYEKLKTAYHALAEKYKLRVIPMGDAVQIYRRESLVKYKNPGTDSKYKEPELPPFDGEVVGYPQWRSGRKDGVRYRYIFHDKAHLNDRGEYMQALCWYAFLFGENAGKVLFVPAGIKAKEAAFLKKCAQKAIKNYKQVK